jgi:hypothetical protein
MSMLNRRNALTAVATLPALAAPAAVAAMDSPDPIFAAIQKHRELMEESNRLYDAVSVAEGKAQKKHGYRPWSLIAWRKYSHIGGSEIDAAREEFLGQPGANRREIEREYRDAKARYAAAVRAGVEWDKRTGLAPLRQQYEHTRRAETTAAMRMAKTNPRTPAGAGALVAYARADIEIGDGPEWHLPALATAADALTSM